MDRSDYLLTKLAEECCEVAQRATKALRFGLGEVQPGQIMTNAERILDEYCDLRLILEVLVEEKIILAPTDVGLVDWVMRQKRARLEKFMEYSRECGRLEY